MSKFFTIGAVTFLLLISLLTNGLVWAFQGEVFMHEFDHNQQSFLIAQSAYTGHQHKEFANEKDSAQLCVSAAYQPLLFTELSFVTGAASKEILDKIIFFKLSQSIPDSLFRPPRINMIS